MEKYVVIKFFSMLPSPTDSLRLVCFLFRMMTKKILALSLNNNFILIIYIVLLWIFRNVIVMIDDTHLWLVTGRPVCSIMSLGLIAIYFIPSQVLFSLAEGGEPEVLL